jgi:chitinase
LSLLGKRLAGRFAAPLFFCAAAACAQPALIVGPYKHLPVATDPAQPVMRTAVTGTTVPVLELGLSAVSWAFAVGECGQENWSGLDAQKVADANVAAFDRAGVGYMLSTGGAIGIFTCGSDAGMERFIRRYASPRLLGVDFDIEGKQTPAQIDSLVRRVKAAQRRWPKLRFSFTLATFAASDGSGKSLNATAEKVMQAIQRHRLVDYHVNLMAMNYGQASPASCLVVDGRCDMGASAEQAALNFHRRWRVPLSHVSLTAMVGVNDVVSNVFTLDDAARVARFVRERGLGGLHWWSLDRDRPCPGGPVVPDCSSLDAPPLAYTEALTR